MIVSARVLPGRAHISNTIGPVHVPGRSLAEGVSSPRIGRRQRGPRLQSATCIGSPVNDLRELKSELTGAAEDVLLSQEMLVTVLAVAGSAIQPAAGILGVGALIKKKHDYSRARNAILRSHAMSWLHLSERPRFSAV